MDVQALQAPLLPVGSSGASAPGRGEASFADVLGQRMDAVRAEQAERKAEKLAAREAKLAARETRAAARDASSPDAPATEAPAVDASATDTSAKGATAKPETDAPAHDAPSDAAEADEPAKTKAKNIDDADGDEASSDGTHQISEHASERAAEVMAALAAGMSPSIKTVDPKPEGAGQGSGQGGGAGASVPTAPVVAPVTEPIAGPVPPELAQAVADSAASAPAKALAADPDAVPTKADPTPIDPAKPSGRQDAPVLGAKGDSSPDVQAQALASAAKGDGTTVADNRLSPAAQRVAAELNAPATVRAAQPDAKPAATGPAPAVAPKTVAAIMAEASAGANGKNQSGSNDAGTNARLPAQAAAPDTPAAAKSQGVFSLDGAGAQAVAVADPASPTSPAMPASPGSSPATPAQVQPRWAALATPAAQVAAQFGAHLGTGAHAYDIQLDPVELGRVRVRLEVGKDGSVSAAISAERPDTLALLRNDARALHQALQDAGLSTNPNSLDFSLSGQRREGSDWSGFAQNGQGGGQGHSGGHGDDGRRERGLAAELMTAAGKSADAASRALDIEV
jgi:hypothetical protein